MQHPFPKEPEVKYEIPTTVLPKDLSKVSSSELFETQVGLKEIDQVLTADRALVDQEIMKRIEASGQKLPALGHSKTYAMDGHRIVVKRDVNLKMDWTVWGEVRSEIPEPMRPTKWIEAVDKSKVSYLRESQPETFAVLAKALTTTPAKPHLTVERSA